MTVANETARKEYDGNDSTTEFAISFYFFVDGDINVYLDEVLQTLTTHYTVADAGEPSGGTLTMLTAPATGEVLTILRDVALTQGTDYVENSSFPADSHEQALDRLTMIVQQLQEEIDRAIIASPESQVTITMPSPEAGKGLVWNSGGTDLENTTDALNDIVTDAETARTAAELAQTNAETAETNAETAETNAETAETNAAASAVIAAVSADNVTQDWIPIEWAEDGASPPDTTEAYTVSNQTVRVRKFRGDTGDQDVTFSIRVPPYIAGSTIKVRPHVIVTEGTGPSNEGVVTSFAGHCNAIGSAFGSVILATKTGWTASQNDQDNLGWSAAITPTGLTAGKILMLKMFRDQDHGSDTYAQDLGYWGIDIDWAP